MKEQLALLIELQKMESAAGRIQARKKDLPVQMEELEEEFKCILRRSWRQSGSSWKV